MAVLHLLLFLILTGCASLSTDPVLASVRRVFLTKQPVIGLFDHDALLGPTTDRFSASAKAGYVYVVFNDTNSHRVQFTITRETAGSVYKVDRLTGSDPRPFRWSASYFEIPLAGKLTEGRYTLDLMVDGFAAGSYPFTVD